MRTLVGSIGLVAAIPLTTAVAALLVLGARPRAAPPTCQAGGVSQPPGVAATRRCASAGQRVTRPRLAVIEALAALEGHPSADTVANAVASDPDPCTGRRSTARSTPWPSSAS